jgi:hypothetical protein
MRFQAQDFPGFALHGHFKRTATNLAISSKALRRHAGIDLQLEHLATERAMNCSAYLHVITNSRSTYAWFAAEAVLNSRL